eukprot:GFUD01041898.1.p1 GENE.GFUD01041898.1~~GFUD01041898.1.p1  ORF type:complete len:321 (+),score=111.22 GFUD01041898.1:52-1014(+)
MVTMVTMLAKIILLGLSSSAFGGDPGVFDEYFDDSIRFVDISQDSAIKACLMNGTTFADKVKAAYNKSFGANYDFNDLAGDNGGDDNGDGLPDNFNEKEARFYKEMKWVDATGKNTDAQAIKDDLTGLEAGLKSKFDTNIDACAAWSGSFGSRRRREAGDSETDEEIAVIPAVMESGSAALTWLRSAVRKTRSAEPGDGKGGKGGKGGNGRNAKKKGKGGKGRSGKDGKGKGGKGKGKPKGKGRNVKNKGKGGNEGNGGKGKGGNGKGKGGNGKGNGNGGIGQTKNLANLSDTAYNKLWCFDLSLEQILEECVEEKINNT